LTLKYRHLPLALLAGLAVACGGGGSTANNDPGNGMGGSGNAVGGSENGSGGSHGDHTGGSGAGHAMGVVKLKLQVK
jgi:hypothetical protein